MKHILIAIALTSSLFLGFSAQAQEQIEEDAHKCLCECELDAGGSVSETALAPSGGCSTLDGTSCIDNVGTLNHCYAI